MQPIANWAVYNNKLYQNQLNHEKLQTNLLINSNVSHK